MADAHCAGCGASCSTAWCPQCGQRQPRTGDFSLRRLAGDAWEELTSSDSRLWRTVAGVFRPGRLTRAWLDYEWQRYLPPVRVFLIASGIYFFLAWDPYFAVNASQVLAAPDSAPSVLQAILLVVIGALLLWAALGVRRVYGRGWVSSAWRGTAIVAFDFVLSVLASQLATAWVLLVPA